MSTPLHQLKADFFKTLGNPVRIRVLELLSRWEHVVAELLLGVGAEAARLSQQPAVLRRANPVAICKEGSTVFYRLATPEVADLPTVARGIRSDVLAGQDELLEDLRAAAPSAGAPSRARRA
ncbi:ArsR/SmtB family transcription factor [Streptomyces sp. NBC_00057]|uniref:ArsR/SmtB family transcription factor n=1 Tax=Streptomyces sp. NBC_00057 TaxID=2975634 RepID=UPI0032442A51